MGYRSTNYGRGQALHGDRTTTGAICCSTLPNCTEHGRGVIRVGDKTTACPKCGKQGVVADGEPRVNWMGQTSAVDGSVVICGCPHGTNRVIAPSGEWLDPVPLLNRSHRKSIRPCSQRAEKSKRPKRSDKQKNAIATGSLRNPACAVKAVTMQAPEVSRTPTSLRWRFTRPYPTMPRNTPRRQSVRRSQNQSNAARFISGGMGITRRWTIRLPLRPKRGLDRAERDSRCQRTRTRWRAHHHFRHMGRARRCTW